MLTALVEGLLGLEDGWVRDRWMHTRHARASASARGLAAIGASCYRCCRSLLLDTCLFSIALPPTHRAALGIVDSCSRFAHRLLRAWEAELRMGADDVGALLGPAIERAWLLGAPQLAPLAPLLSALLRGHVMRAFVPAYSEYTLAEDRRLPPPSPLPPPPLAADAIPIPLPPLLPADGADNDGRAAAADARAPLPFGLDGVRMGTERLGGRVPRVDLLQREGPDGTIVDEYGNAILEVD